MGFKWGQELLKAKKIIQDQQEEIARLSAEIERLKMNDALLPNHTSDEE